MVCPKCAAPVAATDHFCENCGAALAGAPANGNGAAGLTCHCPPGQSKPDQDGYCEVCGIRCVTDAVAANKHVASASDAHLAVVSDVGRRHPTNEDNGAVVRGPGDAVVLVVADGVSTSTDAASASAVAVKVVVSTLLAAPDDAAMSQAVLAAITSADQAVRDLPFAGGDEDGPETTIVVALCRGDRVAIGWAGDSRAYLIGPDTAEQLTRDDSWIEEVVSAGAMPRAQALADRRAHAVTQVLGMRDQPIDIHVVERELPRDHTLLLCSDGLWNYFQESSEIAAALRQSGGDDALSHCQNLVDAANQHGGQDNVTVALLMANFSSDH